MWNRQTQPPKILEHATAKSEDEVVVIKTPLGSSIKWLEDIHYDMSQRSVTVVKTKLDDVRSK